MEELPKELEEITTDDNVYNLPENVIKPEARYNFEQQGDLCLTHHDSSNFLYEDCFTKGCKWAPDGLCFLTNSNDNTLRIWDTPQIFHNVNEWQRSSNISSISPTLSMKEGGLIYDFCWYPLMNSWNPVTCCLASASRDCPVHLWDAFGGQLRATYRAYNQADEVEAARCIAFDPHGERLYCGFKNCVRVFDVAIPGRSSSTRNLKTASGDTQSGIVSCITVCPALPSLYAVGTYLKTIGLYSEDTGRALCILRGHEGGITHMKFSEDGLRLYSGARKDSEILCWDLREPGKVLFSIPRVLMTHQRLYFDLTPDGKHLLSGSPSGDVSIWNTSGSVSDEGILRDLEKVFKAHNDCTNGVSVHPHKPILVTCSGQRHSLEENDNDSENGFELTKASVENSVKLWWAGCQKTEEAMEENHVL